MKYPFTKEQFLNVFKSYNESIFPFQFVFYAIGLFCVYLIFTKIKQRDWIISGILSFFWLWIGIVYHFAFFTAINKAAYLFSFLFILQGIIFIYYAFRNDSLVFIFQNSIYFYVGAFFILYALIIYPVLGYYFGHRYPYNPTFGLPCPTTIFTFGILLFASGKIPVTIIIIPLIWSFLGFGAALNLSIYEDTGLLASGILGSAMIIIKNKAYSVKESSPKLPSMG